MSTTNPISPPTSPPPANWYPDPGGGGQFRYWDGVGWTTHLSPTPLPGGGPPAWNAQTPVPFHPGMRAQSTSNGYSTGGIICGVLAILIFPIILGPVGLILGSIGKSKGEPRGATAMWVAGLGMLAGFVLGFVVLSSMQSTY